MRLGVAGQRPRVRPAGGGVPGGLPPLLSHRLKLATAAGHCGNAIGHARGPWCSITSVRVLTTSDAVARQEAAPGRDCAASIASERIECWGGGAGESGRTELCCSGL